MAGVISTAVGLDRVENVIGYEVKKGFFVVTSGNLPQRVAIFGQANTDKQAEITANGGFVPRTILSAEEAGDVYGYGSMIHGIMRILRNVFADAIGGIPTVVYPQPAPSGGAARIQTITATGTATAGKTITIRVNGRDSIDGSSYELRVDNGDTAAVIHQKIADLINATLSCPVSATSTATEATLTTKWTGAVSQETEIEVIVPSGGVPGVSFAVAETQAGAGSLTGDIQTSLGQFGNEWNTIVVNPYGEDEAMTFKDFNGTPGENEPSSRWNGEIFKPFVALFGDKEATTFANLITLGTTDATNVRCVAPNSKGFSYEAAANCALLLARQAQDSPHLDTAELSYPDMPIPADNDIGLFSVYNNRDQLVKNGCSTVDLVNGAYQIQSLITGYRKLGEVPPQFRYVRTIVIDMNIGYGHFILATQNLKGKSIVPDSQTVTVQDVIKPKQWRQILRSFATRLSEISLIVEPEFMQESIDTGTGAGSNPDRLDTTYDYKRAPYGRVFATTGTAGFAFNI